MTDQTANAGFTLPQLPYQMTDLEPFISSETLEFHYGKHHRAYFAKLNELVRGSDLEGLGLEELVRQAEGAVFNNAAQVWNHMFYWNSMSPTGGGAPAGQIGEGIRNAWGDFASFQSEFNDAATDLFGSGWVWLVQESGDTLAISTTSNAGTPLREKGRTPLLTCDVWEHAYYIDHRNARPSYLGAWWQLVNWEFAEHNLTRPKTVSRARAKDL